MSSLVHLDVDVSALYRVEFSRHVTRRAVADIPKIEVIWSANKDRRIFLRCVFRPIDIGRHALTVTHRDHELALDNSNRLQFILNRVSPGDHFRGQAGSSLGLDSLFGDSFTDNAESHGDKDRNPDNLISHVYAPRGRNPQKTSLLISQLNALRSYTYKSSALCHSCWILRMIKA